MEVDEVGGDVGEGSTPAIEDAMAWSDRSSSVRRQLGLLSLAGIGREGASLEERCLGSGREGGRELGLDPATALQPGSPSATRLATETCQ